jgi:hypothetical protein
MPLFGSSDWIGFHSSERRKDMKTLIVSRHPAAIEFIRAEQCG